MANIRSFKELRVWQNAMNVAMRVFELSKRFPIEERYSLTDQFRRASRSVAANIAEAWRKRRYQAAFVSKLNDAEGEAAECQTWAEVARRCKYLSETDADDLDVLCDQVLGQLVCMIDQPGHWVVKPNRSLLGAASPRLRVSASPRLRVSASPPPSALAPWPPRARAAGRKEGS